MDLVVMMVVMMMIVMMMMVMMMIVMIMMIMYLEDKRRSQPDGGLPTSTGMNLQDVVTKEIIIILITITAKVIIIAGSPPSPSTL